MFNVDFFNVEDVLNQNCRVGKIYAKCDANKLCNPQSEFEMLESCKDCKKII
jgi:hypothetical protein